MSLPSAAWEDAPVAKVQPLGDALPAEGDAFILNSYHDVQFLTREQALDLINTITGILLADHYARGGNNG
ncbi:MAG: hypothetical protein EOM68_24100 [Spirochaetia bacterium]|nr:hypothetical protein [Spirochaetia bacterium]